MENMLEEVNWCKSKMKKHFNKPLKMTKENEEAFQKAENVIYVIKSTLTKIYVSEIIAISQENTEDQLIKNAI